MNIYISILIILVCLFFIISATTAYVEKDKTFSMSGIQTYRWVETKSSVSDPSSRLSGEAIERIQSSVEKELSKWGWRLSNERPDVLVSYDVLVNKIREREQAADTRYTESFRRFYYNEYSEKWSPIDYPGQFVGYDVYEGNDKPSNPVDKATFTITLLETQTDKKIWQGWITEKLKERRLTEKEIERSVGALLRNP